MAQEKDFVWLVADNGSISLYTCEKYAKEAYNERLRYYNTHKPDASDFWTYSVYLENKDEMPYTIFEKKYKDKTETFMVYYSKKEIIK